MVRLSGNPLDDGNLPFSVDSPGITINLSSAAIFASQALCGARPQQCGADPSSGPAWFPVNPGFLRNQDVVVVELGVRDFVATADSSSGTPVPVAWIYDVY